MFSFQVDFFFSKSLIIWQLLRIAKMAEIGQEFTTSILRIPN